MGAGWLGCQGGCELKIVELKYLTKCKKSGCGGMCVCVWGGGVRVNVNEEYFFVKMQKNGGSGSGGRLNK